MNFAQAASRPSEPASAAHRARSLTHAVIAGLFLLIAALLFTMSSGMLWKLGINYNGVTGAIATKIHPATYLTVITIAFLIMARANPASFFVGLVTRHPGTLAFMLATLL